MIKPDVPREPQTHRAFSLWLDFFRWTAAFLVLLAHTERELLVRLADIASAQRPHLYYAYAAVSGFGHQAVMIFFVLSGYLVGGGLWRELNNRGRIDLKRYWLNRITRMGVVVLPGLVLIGLCGAIAIRVFHGLAAGVYTESTVASLSAKTFACNAVFLQTAACDNYGKNGALWSLYNEFWYYLVWPLLLLGFSASSLWRRVSLLALSTVLLVGFTWYQSPIYPSFAPYMVIWLIGVGIARLPKPMMKSSGMAAVLFCVAMLLERAGIRESFAEQHRFLYFLIDLGLGLLFANIVLAMKFQTDLRIPWGREWNTRLAAFSFSLYCIHLPLLNLYSSALNYSFHTGALFVPDSSLKWLFVLGALIFCVGCSFVFALATERNTGHVRSWLAQLAVSKKQSATLAN